MKSIGLVLCIFCFHFSCGALAQSSVLDETVYSSIGFDASVIADNYRVFRPAVRQLRFYELIRLNALDFPVEVKLDIARMAAEKAELPHELQICFRPFEYVMEPLPPVLGQGAAGDVSVAFGLVGYPEYYVVGSEVGVSREERIRLRREKEMVRRRIRHLTERFYPRVAEKDYDGEVRDYLRRLGGSAWKERVENICKRAMSGMARAIEYETLHPIPIF